MSRHSVVDLQKSPLLQCKHGCKKEKEKRKGKKEKRKKEKKKQEIKLYFCSLRDFIINLPP
jgi:hypothetical protein